MQLIKFTISLVLLVFFNITEQSYGLQVEYGPFVSIQVNVDDQGNNIVGDAANEPSIAIDPTNSSNMVIGWRQFETIEDDFREAGWAYSHDGGKTWTFPGVLETGGFRTDPVLDADTDGNFYYYSLTKNNNDYLYCNLFKSTDKGVAWQNSTFTNCGDKIWMAIDKTNSMGRNNIYTIWQPYLNPCNRRTFARSSDGGKSFLFPIEVPHMPAFGTIAVGPEGEVYASGVNALQYIHFYFIRFFHYFVVVKSTDAQDPADFTPTFSSSIVNMGGFLNFLDLLGPNPFGIGGQVWIAVDHSSGSSRGNVYVLSSVVPYSFWLDPLDVHFIRSTNGGVTWSKPIRVNDDPLNINAWQWFGTLSVAPNGRLDAVWNDTRNTGQANMSELYYSYSLDSGETWSLNIQVSPVFDSYIGFPINNEKIGDYYHMISDNAAANLAYAATFNQEQDIYFLKIGDCNNNGIHDSQDIDRGNSVDENNNLIPDECESVE